MKTIFILFALVAGVRAQVAKAVGDVPVATQWTLDAAGPVQRQAINSIVMIVCPKSGSKGTGFILRGGLVATAAHVVGTCQAEDLVALSPHGAKVTFVKLASDQVRDIAILRPSVLARGGLEIDTLGPSAVGVSVSTWGFPLGYSGPAPLLSVGFLSGFINHGDQKQPVKHLVVNGAFNPGNSGGPLFLAGSEKVIGIVVSKHAPLTPFVVSAINALARNQSGVTFSATDAQGNAKQFVESQIVAEILMYYRQLSQVMIGEAVAASELNAYIKQCGANLLQ